MKKDIDAHGILQYLYKNTDLQVSYNFNMIAIHNRRPTMMTLPLRIFASGAVIRYWSMTIANRRVGHAASAAQEIQYATTVD